MKSDDLESLATETCRLLGAEHLKAICRHRAFLPPGGGRVALGAFVAARLLEPAGVREAMASLDPMFLTVLHRVALAGGSAPVRDVQRLLHPDDRRYGFDARADFGRLAGGLLNRGVVLLHDGPLAHHDESRYARIELVLPDAHRGGLPPFPATSSPLGEDARRSHPIAFCRQALAAAARAAGQKVEWEKDLAGQIASRFSFTDGRLALGGRTALDFARLFEQLVEIWTAPGHGGPSSRTAAEARRAAAYILEHLPEGHGLAAPELARAVERIGVAAPERDLANFCEEGAHAGLLAWEGAPAGRRYGSPAGHLEDPGDAPLAFTVSGDAIEVDLERCPLGPVLELAAFCRVEPRGGHLRLAPDLVAMGRAAGALSRIPLLVDGGDLRSRCAAFDRAVRQVEARRGGTTVHEGLLLIRAEDVGLRAQILARFGPEVRALGGPYLAALRGAQASLEAFVRKEGFVPRRRP